MNSVSRQRILKLYALAVVLIVVGCFMQSQNLQGFSTRFKEAIYKTSKFPRIFQRESAAVNITWKLVTGNTTSDNSSWVQSGLLYELPAYNVSVFSAIGRNRSRNSGWDEIILNGWEGKTHFNDSYDCCLYYPNGDVIQVNVSEKNHWLQCKAVHYTATQFTCPNFGPRSGSQPLWVTMTASNMTCATATGSESRIRVTFPLRKPKLSLALCAKIAYGSVSPYRLIEWYEVQKALGVSKIITFTYNLTMDATRVLEKYQKEGLVTLFPYGYPHKDRLPRSVGDKNQHVFNDEQVVAFDCAERLSGYHFVGLIDHDEYLIPTPVGIPRLNNLLKTLLRRNPYASGFSFRTELFLTNWHDASTTSVSNYRFRTRPMWDRRKSLYIPDRVVPGSIWTHNFTDVTGYKRSFVGSAIGSIKHFRSCRQQWVDKNSCFSRRRYRDQRLAKYIRGLNGTILRSVDSIFGREWRKNNIH